MTKYFNLKKKIIQPGWRIRCFVSHIVKNTHTHEMVKILTLKIFGFVTVKEVLSLQNICLSKWALNAIEYYKSLEKRKTHEHFM